MAIYSQYVEGYKARDMYVSAGIGDEPFHIHSSEQHDWREKPKLFIIRHERQNPISTPSPLLKKNRCTLYIIIKRGFIYHNIVSKWQLKFKQK